MMLLIVLSFCWSGRPHVSAALAMSAGRSCRGCELMDATPTGGYVKCNIHGAFPMYHNRVGIRMCMHDEFGLFVGDKTIWLQPIMEVSLGEAVALLKALEWIKELGFQDVIFSHGSKTIIDDFNSSVNNFNIDNVSIPLLNASR